MKEVLQYDQKKDFWKKILWMEMSFEMASLS